jgi:two-component system OmpR family response regulator
MPDVVLLPWPEERDETPRLVSSGVAVLYLVDSEDEPPAVTSCLEDWVRVPGDDRDIRARIAALEVRAAVHTSRPHVDHLGTIHYRTHVVSLAGAQADIARELSAHVGEVVPDADLVASIDARRTSPPAPSLRMEIARLRALLRPLGLTIGRVRGRGYRLDQAG